MTPNTLLVTGIGHAIMDICASVETDFVEQSGLIPGNMTLVDNRKASSLTARLGKQMKPCPGGSASNTIADLAELGAQCGFIGCCADDDWGKAYLDDMHDRHIEMTLPEQPTHARTGCSIVLVTPDGERTMATCPGIAAMVQAHHVDTCMIARSQWLLIETYLLDMPAGDQVLDAALQAQQTANTKLAVSLSDARCIKRHHNRVKRLIARKPDLLIGNINEAREVFPDSSDTQAISMLADTASVVAVTNGPQATVVVNGGNRTYHTPKTCPVVDTTGAGDCFASGFLYALSKELDVEACANLGHERAAQCIGHLRARNKPSVAK